MKKAHYLLLAICLLISGNVVFAQGVAINTDGSEADASAMLDVSSTSKGFLAPRMLSGERTAISSPATGLLVYQTDGSAGYYYYNGTAWVLMGEAADRTQWTTTGDDIYYNSGNVGIGTSTPYSKLEVHDKIIAGNETSTNGMTLIEARYSQSSNDAVNIIGSMYSSAAWLLGLGMRPKSGSYGYISSGDNVAWERSGLELSNDFFQLLYAPTQLTTVGNDITGLTSPFYVDLVNGNVGIGTTTPETKLDVDGEIACTKFKPEYTNIYTIDATYVSGTWFNVIPVNTLAPNATYVVSFYFNNVNWGPPYYLQAATTIRTSFSNGTGTGNEVILPTASHVSSTDYSIAVRNRMSSGFVSTGLDVQLNGFESHNGETITVKAKRIL